MIFVVFLSVLGFGHAWAQTPTVTLTDTPTTAPTSTTTPTPTPDNSKEKLDDLNKKIGELQGKITDLQNQGKTLASQIGVMDNQINLTQLRIQSTQKELNDLEKYIATASKKIDKLDISLKDITKVLLNRIIVTYEIGPIEPIQLFLSSNTANDFLNKSNYLKIVQEHDKKLLFETQQAKNDYENQKDIFETKKKRVVALKNQLEEYTAQLAVDKKNKQSLLDVTKNDEKRYQQLLANVRSEYQSIQGIVSGNGIEKEINKVSEGQVIASIIQGASCNSSGAHVHFIVSKNGDTENPFSYLKSVDYENCSGSSCGSGNGDAFNPSGGWNWPIDPKIRMNQGYGATWATRNDPIIRQIYSFHNGIDIAGSSSVVKAVQSGVLFQGSYTGASGCRLRYVRVRHDDGGLDTLYLHVNYVF